MEGGDENKIRNLMTLSLSLSIILSFLLGMDYTNMIPGMKGRYFIFAFLNFLTAGICVFTSIILYFQELRKSFNVFYYDIKVTWITHSAYITIFLYIVGGIICLLSYRESNKSSQDLEDSPIQSLLTQSENIQIKTDAREKNGSFPEETPIENFNRTSLSSTSKLRRVTWAFQILGQL
ncbi:transmembrane protein 225 isoform X2 [Notamacropus eugenii]|uniref:transmembrane protein 225 isoform X2 n=1 Tax=Notamacropus eugenii TaxID=9315 RepID=UPI003B6787FC